MRRLAAISMGLLLLVGSIPFISPTNIVSAEDSLSRPATIRGFNTFGRSVTMENAAQLREEYGVNAVRLQIHPRQWREGKALTNSEAWDAVLDQTEAGLEEAARQGMVAIIDMHSLPMDISDKSSAFWGDEDNLDVWMESWEEVVQRLEPYRDYIWGYDILNEPHNIDELPVSSPNWQAWTQQVVDAIRQLDSTTPVIIEPDPGALPRVFKENVWIDAGPGYPVKYQGDFPLIDDEHVIYSVHFYEPHVYTHQGIGYHNGQPETEVWPDQLVYPGIINGVYWDKEKLREVMQPIVDIQNKYNVPIYVGEFSAVRWAPGSAQYIRDAIELFEEFGWSWTFHAYGDWNGWSVDYNDQMTSDANKEAARAIEPTDRELILKAFFSKNANQFVAPLDSPRSPVNLIKNGDFTLDGNEDGLGNNWIAGANAETSIVELNDNPVQKITTGSDKIGISQEWMNATDQNVYRLKANIRVDQGTARFWLYTVNSSYSPTTPNHRVVADLGPTNGEFEQVDLDFIAPEQTAKLSVRFWSTTANSSFYVDDVELIDLGKANPENPPQTVATITGEQISQGTYYAPVNVQFAAEAFGGASMDHIAFRIAGENSGWATVPGDELLLEEPGQYVVGFYSVDSAGIREPAQSILLNVIQSEDEETCEGEN
ncbi:Cellulase (glycosyl hydrolase family 5) [Paenibacillus algorifonticola]|uniref:Cellulase (Glycosyl hydrolase family 5) n=1 Tax=Paenibacillus algorifonticola TaxID=684063 RepID=A0A1I2GTV8_9BACL|nr:cellulase family glycosylhydrolase [Paenibacillus algorifonticola]SFF21065.1 Cellulase (glycosyl hydrolase family 5) [Paenibacillus algorifonticola]